MKRGVCEESIHNSRPGTESFNYEPGESVNTVVPMMFVTGALALDIAAIVILVSAENDLLKSVFEYNKSICGKQSNMGMNLKLVKNIEF